jgi:hypothetical protein
MNLKEHVEKRIKPRISNQMMPALTALGRNTINKH